MKKIPTVIIGAGAAGIVAGISARLKGVSTVICEKMPLPGKKILASGNGRCNLLNDDFTEQHYNPTGRELAGSVFAQFGKTEILEFFHRLGLKTYSQDGRIFPLTNQASSVLKVLELEISRLGVSLEPEFEVSNIVNKDQGFVVRSKKGKEIACEKLIIACGGKAYPAYGADGALYPVIARLGHTIIEPIPSAVPVVTKDRLCHFLQGQRIRASAKAMAGTRLMSEASGELIFAQYGLSGTCILDISEEISVAINRDHCKDISVVIDMVPFMEERELREEISRRRSAGLKNEEILIGILPNKFAWALRDIFGTSTAEEIAVSLKKRSFKITGTRGWNEAEFTCGGVDVSQIKPGTLESKVIRGLYFAGEILDVNGKRGGYNLGWAWASGFVAGLCKNENV